MTIEEKVELVERTRDAFAADGVEAILRFFAEDCVWYPFPEWLEEPEYRGHDGLRAITGVWTDNFDDFEMIDREIRPVNGRVVALGETAGRIKSSGAAIQQPVGIVYSDFRDGKIGRIQSFLTWKQALEAAAVPG